MCVLVFDLKCRNVLFVCLKLAQYVQAQRIGLFSGCGSTFRVCASSNKDYLCCEAHLAWVMLWADHRLVEVVGGERVSFVRRQCCWLHKCCVLLRVLNKSKHTAVKAVGGK